MTVSPRILLLEGIHPVARDAFRDAGCEVEVVDGALSERDLAARMRGFSFVGIRSKTQITAAVLEGADELLALGAFCIGTNQVALDAATHHGVAVFNAPFSNTRSVAELVLAEVVMLSRQLGDRVREMHGGKWRKTAAGAREVRGKTIGVVGYGHIGSQIGVLAEAFGMRVVFHDVVSKLPMGNNQPAARLLDVLAQADFVTLHVPATPQTHLMIGEREIAAMKPGACLLNLSRGTVVDLAALAAALKSGHLGGASIDVFPSEPEKSLAEGFESELRGLDNVILTPHIGGSTLEAQEAIGREVSAALLKYLRTGSTTGSVNFPTVELPLTGGAHRLSNVHKNVPGVLSDVNRIVSEAGANVQAQLLTTLGDVGYLVMDLDRPVTEISARMSALPTTIRARAIV